MKPSFKILDFYLQHVTSTHVSHSEDPAKNCIVELLTLFPEKIIYYFIHVLILLSIIIG